MQTTGTLTIRPRTAGTTVGIGSGSGTLAITDAFLSGTYSSVSAGAYIFGSAESGTLTINTTHDFGSADVSFLSGSSISFAGNLPAASIFAQAGSDISIASGSTLSASGSGTAVTLVADRNFLNYSSTPIILTSDGRWLIYSTQPSDNTLNGLTADFNRYTCTYGGSCPSFPSTGNGLLYSFTPILTVTPAEASLIYGNSAASLLSGYGYSLTGYLGADASSDAVTGILTGNTTYTIGSNIGTYNVDYLSGALASALGYAFTYANSASAIVVSQRSLTVVANDKTIYAGMPNPVFTGSNTMISQDAAVVEWSYAAINYQNYPGTYAIVATSSDPQNRLANYIVTTIDGTLRALALPDAVIANSQAPAMAPSMEPQPAKVIGALWESDLGASFNLYQQQGHPCQKSIGGRCAR